MISLRLYQTLILIALLFTEACSSPKRPGQAEAVNVVSQPLDKKLLEQLFTLHSEDQGTSISTLMTEVGAFFSGTPYVAHTLEREVEEVVVNLREFDCTTFAESCLAISRTIRSGNHTFEQFVAELVKIRYRDGEVDGYTSRLHYFSDWIHTNGQKQLIRDVSGEIGGIPFPNQLNFMSTHPGSYRQLAADSTLIEIIAGQEQEISAREMYYISENDLKNTESSLMEGDIVGITTAIGGLDIMHVGILISKSGRIHLLHASSRAEKVVLSEETLEEYLMNSKAATGIIVARPLQAISRTN
ncbi:MAG: DUF1460 domain-containing protein [Bacteroidetes bacterium]|nr:DUF1460 domain-containing protein [Bacteroidota bacterium]